MIKLPLWSLKYPLFSLQVPKQNWLYLGIVRACKMAFVRNVSNFMSPKIDLWLFWLPTTMKDGSLRYFLLYIPLWTLRCPLHLSGYSSKFWQFEHMTQASKLAFVMLEWIFPSPKMFSQLNHILIAVTNGSECGFCAKNTIMQPQISPFLTVGTAQQLAIFGHCPGQ